MPGEVSKCLQKQSYLQPPVLNAMYDAEKQMQEIMEAPQITAAEKSKLYSDQLNRFFTFKNKMENHHLPVKTSPPSEPVPSTSDKREEITPRRPVSPKPNFLTPPATEEERPKLQGNFFHNWLDSSDWRPKDIAMITPEQRDGYEKRLLGKDQNTF